MLRSAKNASTSSRMPSPLDHETIRFRHTGGLGQPEDADDPPLLDGAVDLLEDADHGVRPPDLRELVLRHLQLREHRFGLLGGQQPVLRDEFVLEHVEPQGGLLLCSSAPACRAAGGPAGTFEASAGTTRGAFSNPGPPGFFPADWAG